jgi:sporulation integral membrane protein YlbJ
MIIIDAVKNKSSKVLISIKPVSSVAIVWIFSIFLLGYFIKSPAACAESVKNALKVCAERLIPSLFPFIVLVGIIGSSGLSDAISSLFGSLFERIFGISRNAACAFLIGSIGGFPVGAIMARELFENNKISSDEAERLTAFSNNAGLAFCVGGIGSSLFNNTSVGWLIYLCQLSSAIIIGIAQNKTGSGITYRAAKTNQRFGIGELLKQFSDSVAKGGLTMLKICSFAVFFAVVGDVLISVLNHYFGELSAALGASICELTLATRLASQLGRRTAIPICAFAAGFAGISVHMQVASALSGSRISMRRYFYSKCVQGIISAIFAALLFELI